MSHACIAAYSEEDMYKEQDLDLNPTFVFRYSGSLAAMFTHICDSF